jgi:hypothetical protein
MITKVCQHIAQKVSGVFDGIRIPITRLKRVFMLSLQNSSMTVEIRVTIITKVR